MGIWTNFLIHRSPSSIFERSPHCQGSDMSSSQAYAPAWETAQTLHLTTESVTPFQRSQGIATAIDPSKLVLFHTATIAWSFWNPSQISFKFAFRSWRKLEQSSTPIVPCSIGYAGTRRSGTVLSLCFSNPVARILWSLPPPLFRSKLMQRPINFQCGANMPSPTPHFFLPGYTISNQFKSYHTIWYYLCVPQTCRGSFARSSWGLAWWSMLLGEVCWSNLVHLECCEKCMEEWSVRHRQSQEARHANGRPAWSLLVTIPDFWTDDFWQDATNPRLDSLMIGHAFFNGLTAYWTIIPQS